MADDRTEEERAPVIVDLAKARGMACARLLAVDVFLSVIGIPSRQLVSYMKNVWRIRGTVDSLQLADKCFVLEFSEVGDFEHVTKGGPWRFQGDAVLVRALEQNEDPNEVEFEVLAIWAQFADIPFYLLSKQLARKLENKLGHLISIDNHARGNLNHKILRARVAIPIAHPLQRWITLEDEFSDEEVLATVLYERLPNFCLYCGVIGHEERNYDLPAAIRRKRYTASLGVQPTHPEDPSKWYLPETAGENGRALHMDLPWRNVAALGSRLSSKPKEHLAIVASVAAGVEKMSVKEG
jgi:hypothetical protein